MKISQLYVYPIKSLRPTRITEGTLTPRGLPYDRHFMLLKVESGREGDAASTLKNMQIAHFPEMALFQTDIDADAGTVVVTYNPPSSDGKEPKNASNRIEIPLYPDVDELQLQRLDIDLHKSPTTGYDMGSRYNDWFSGCFGYPVVLAYLGPHSREVLGRFAPSKQKRVQSWNSPFYMQGVGGLVFLVGICLANGMPFVKSIMDGGMASTTVLVPGIVIAILGLGYYYLFRHDKRDQITFADCAPYLVISETSVANVAGRLPDGIEMDLTKFRPNIVVSGADTAFEEDFWSTLRIGRARTRLLLTANCLRCQSLNIDFSTGKMNSGAGNMLKTLMRDRRVDPGVKYSPVFGRYSFLDPKCSEGKIRVGDEVVVEERALERTGFDWPGVTN
ncbi:MOSC domain-containing protein [Aspergillus floccosus]